MPSLFNKRKASRSRTTAACMIAVAGCAMCLRAQAQQTPQPPYALFEQSTLTGSGNTINVSWIPVVTASGSTIYKNLVLQFDVDAAGNLTISTGYPQVTAAATMQISAFVAGTYNGPSTVYSGKMGVTVTGPGVTPNGSTEWTLAASPSAYAYTYPSSATWYVGSLDTNPLAARVQAAKLTSTVWSYGVIGSEPYGTDGGKWITNSLIGVSQVGRTLTFVTFTDANGVDHNTPLDQVTYTLVP